MKERPLLVVVEGLDGRNITSHQLHVGENLAAEIMAVSPDKFGGSSVYIYRDNVNPDNLIPEEIVPTICIMQDDFYVLRATPAQQAIIPVLTAVAFAAVVYFTAGIGAALLVGGLSLAAGLAASLIPMPKIPSAATAQDQPSGLNTLGAPSNLSRLGSRVPEILGLMRIWPDLAVPAIEEWSGRTQKITAVYSIGVGYYEISGYKLGETSIINLPGVSVEQYGPGTTLPQMFVARLSASQQEITLDATGTAGGNYSAWITAVGDRVGELWIDVGFPSGLVVYRSSGGKRTETTSIRFDYQRLDIPGQPIISVDFTYSEATGNPLRYTTKIVKILPLGVYRVRARRLDDGTHGDNDVHVSNVSLIRVIGIESLPANSRNTYKNTLVKLIIENNDQVAQLSSLTFNLIVKRMLHLVNSDGTVSPNFVATSFLRDAIYYVLHDPSLGNFFTADIDIQGLYSLHATLTDIDFGEAAQFNGVFDRWSSVDEMAQTIMQVARAAAIYDGGRIVFMRDEDRAAPISVFNRRVRPADDQSTRVMQFVTPDEEDGVSIEWMDSDNGYVNRTYIYPTTAINPRTVSLVGATHWSQVYRRAVYEWDRQRYRRRTQKIQVTEEGLICNPLDIITVIDPWLDPISDGDIVDYDPSSLLVTIDQPAPSTFGSVMRIRNIEGDLTDDVPIAPSNIPGTVIRLTRAPIFTIVPRDATHQVGNLYILGSVTYLDQHDWHVLDVNSRDRKTVELSLVEYSPIVFRCDTLPLPAPPFLQ